MYKILLIADVPNWAWGYKSKYIQKYLSNDFKIDILYVEKNSKFEEKYDLYMNYTPAHIKFLEKNKIDKDRIITGITGIPAYRKHIKNKGSLENRVAGVHANSIQFLNLLKKEKSHNRIYYTPNGVDIDIFKPSPFPNKKKIQIGFIGKPIPDKGYSNFVVPSVKKAGGILISNTKNWKNAENLNSISKFYSKIDAFIVASITDGTPNPALEAAACGKTIISNRIGNMPQFIKDGVNGFLINTRNINKYIEKINILNSDRKLIKQMGNEARKTVEESWTWKIMAENYRNMFREVLGI